MLYGFFVLSNGAFFELAFSNVGGGIGLHTVGCRVSGLRMKESYLNKMVFFLPPKSKRIAAISRRFIFLFTY